MCFFYLRSRAVEYLSLVVDIDTYLWRASSFISDSSVTTIKKLNSNLQMNFSVFLSGFVFQKKSPFHLVRISGWNIFRFL